MKDLEAGKDKIQKICDVLRKETLDPAKQEAREIVENAHLQSDQIVSEAKKRAKTLLQSADQEIEEKRKALHSSLELASRQTVEQLKQRIEKDLFNQELASLVREHLSKPNVIAELINHWVTKMDEDVAVTIPKEIEPNQIISLLTKKVLDRLQNKPLKLGEFEGGIEIQLKDKKITIAMTDLVLRELLAQYIRKDLRETIFKS